MFNLSLNEPKDIRELIKVWILEACELKRLPFDRDGGTIVQLLNLWLRSYETEKLSDLEERISRLEGAKK
jgi:hypothetical protein